MHRIPYAVLAALVAATAPSFAQTAAGTATFGQPSTTSCPNCLSAPSNTIVLDASAGKLMQPLPSGQRNFASASEFATFLQTSLSAIPVYDGAGNVIGASGNILRIGRTYYLDSTNTIRPITEPISAFIGGIPATFTVAGVTYNTGIQGQDYLVPQRVMSVPTDVYECNRYGECISGHSWNKHWIGHIYDSVGVEVDQETGGYQESLSVCWAFIFPYPCITSSGTNTLSLTGYLWADPISPRWSTNSTQSNVTHIELNSWSVCFIGSCGPGDASSLVGACEAHSSAAIPSRGATAVGTYGSLCPGPVGVTCSSGYTLCQPNNVCTTPSNDVNNCGTCGNVCPGGYSCQSGACVPPPPPPPPPLCRAGYTFCDPGCVKWPAVCP
jgi:hypothetical protein